MMMNEDADITRSLLNAWWEDISGRIQWPCEKCLPAAEWIRWIQTNRGGNTLTDVKEGTVKNNKYSEHQKMKSKGKPLRSHDGDVRSGLQRQTESIVTIINTNLQYKNSLSESGQMSHRSLFCWVIELIFPSASEAVLDPRISPQSLHNSTQLWTNGRVNSIRGGNCWKKLFCVCLQKNIKRKAPLWILPRQMFCLLWIKPIPIVIQIIIF